MFNLKLGLAKNLAKVISSGATSSAAQQDESEQKGAAGPWFRSASAVGGDALRSMQPIDYGHDGDDDDQEGQNCDPLIYRLQHQKRHLKEKLLHNRSGKLRRSISERGGDFGRSSRERDPFDLGGSLTSEEASLGNNELVVGWGSGSSRRKRSIHLSDDDDDDDQENLLVDFGGVTPSKMNVGRSLGSICSSDATHFSAPKFSAPNSSQPANQHNLEHQRDHGDEKFVYSDEIDEEGWVEWYQPKRHHATKSSNSTTKNSTNNSHLSVGSEGSAASTRTRSPRPSQQDLAHILSSLENESLASEPEPQNGTVALSCCSSLSSPTSKCRKSLPMPSSPTPPLNLHISSASPVHIYPQHDQQYNQKQQHPSPIITNSYSPQQISPSTSSLHQPQQQQQQQQQQEEDPRLAQLKQQTTDELRTELYKMQAQSKNNLEKSWAETERMRVENSELDDQLAQGKREFDASRAADMLSSGSIEVGWQQRTPTRGSRISSNSGSQSIINKCRSSSLGSGDTCRGKKSQPKSLQGSKSAKSLFDPSQETESYSSSIPLGSVGKSYRNRRNYSAGATKALMGNSVDNHEVTRSKSDSGRGSGKPNRHFLVDLGKSIRGTKSSGGSVGGSDFGPSFHELARSKSESGRGSGKPNRNFLSDLGKSFRGAKSSGCSVDGIDSDFGLSFEIDSDDVKSSASNFDGTHEKLGEIPNSLLSKSSTPHNHPSGLDVYSSDDDSSDARSGVFYPPPGEDKVEKYCNSRESLPESSSIDLAEMADFDFDPLNESPLVSEDQGSSHKSPNGKTKERRSGFRRRPSFMSLFEEKITVPSDDEDNIVSSSTPPRQKKDSAATVKSLILEKDNEIGQLIESIRAQVDDMRKCEVDIVRENAKCAVNEKQFKTKESKLQQNVEELEKKYSANESKLDYAEGSEQKAREKECALKEKLASLQEEECEVDLEKHLSCYQQQYNTSQENAISSLSSLLNDFDVMCIPSLRGELEDNVCGDIIARFDDLTDKEEELVKVLSDADRTSCQASCQQIKTNIEMAMSLQNQLAHLEADLHSHLGTITMLIKQDDEGTHTTESSTASERLSLERVFAEAIILHLGTVKQKQGKPILDALFKSVEFLTNWCQWLLPDFASSSPPSRSSSGDLGTVVSTIAMLKGVVKKASAELAAVKSDVLNEQAKFQAKMQSAGLSSRPNSSGIFNSCNVNTATNDHIGSSHDDSEERLTRETEVEELNRQISRQIHVAETILSERESLMLKYASFFRPMQAQARESKANFQLLEEILEEDTAGEQLEELDKQISTATEILSEKESLMNKYSSELGSIQAQAAKDSKTNLQLLNKIQIKIKHILVKLADEESLIASLKGLLRAKKEKVGKVESQQRERVVGGFVQR